MKKFNLFLCVLILFLGVVFVGCEKAEELVVVDNQSEVSKEIRYECEKPIIVNGIFVFKNKLEMRNYLENFYSNIKEFQQFEEENNFESQQTILWNAIKADQELYYEQTVNVNDTTIKNNVLINSELTTKYLAEGLIKKDAENNILLTTCAPFYAPVLNEKNLVIINDTIYQFTSQTMKMITDGDLSKLNILEKSNKNDLKNGIIVAENKSTKDYKKSFNYQTVFECTEGSTMSYPIKGGIALYTTLSASIWEYNTANGLWRYVNY